MAKKLIIGYKYVTQVIMHMRSPVGCAGSTVRRAPSSSARWLLGSKFALRGELRQLL